MLLDDSLRALQQSAGAPRGKEAGGGGTGAAVPMPCRRMLRLRTEAPGISAGLGKSKSKGWAGTGCCCWCLGWWKTYPSPQTPSSFCCYAFMVMLLSASDFAQLAVDQRLRAFRDRCIPWAACLTMPPHYLWGGKDTRRAWGFLQVGVPALCRVPPALTSWCDTGGW